MIPRQGKGKLPRELGALEIMVGERFSDCRVKSGFIPERLILMGTWEKPLCWGSGVRQCPWWGGGAPGVVTACVGAKEERGLFLIHAEFMYQLTYVYPEDSILASSLS